MRLSKLELRAGVPQPNGRKPAGQKAQTKEEEFDARWEEATTRLLSTMAEKHLVLLARWGEKPIKGTKAARLHNEAYRRIGEAVKEHRGDSVDPVRPLALPREVAQFYLEDPHAATVHDCEDCGYRVPAHIDDPKPRRKPPWGVHESSLLGHDYGADESSDVFYQPFPDCPLCGSFTGYNAFARKHERDTLEADGDWRGRKKRELDELRARPQTCG